MKGKDLDIEVQTVIFIDYDKLHTEVTLSIMTMRQYIFA